jgi:RHS repeat-associated protein
VSEKLFAGEQFDPTLDQYYLRARYYDPSQGRFTQMDEWDGKACTPITLNKYIYGNADPVSFVDPSGNIGLMLVSMPITASPAYNFRRQELRNSAAKTIKMLRSICRSASNVVNTLTKPARHHVIPKFLGGKKQWDPELLLRMETAVHQRLHTLLDIGLKLNGLPGGRDGMPGGATKYYERIYSKNPGARKDVYKILLKVGEIFDHSCPGNPGGSLVNKIKSLKKTGFR